MNQSGQKNFQTKRKVVLLYFLLTSNPFHLQIKELKLDHSKQLQAIRSEMKILQKAIYRPTKAHIYAQFVQTQAPLNKSTPRIPLPQNQQLVTTNSMNLLMLPFFPISTTKHVS